MCRGKERAKYASHETLCRGLGKVQLNRSSLMPNLATGKCQASTLNRNEFQKYDIISGEASILKRTMLHFFTKTLVQMARQGRAYQARSQVR
jgi:hypothetical protein